MNYARRIRQCSSCLIRCTNVLHLALGVICWFACVLHVRWIWFIAAVLGLYSVLSFLVRRKRKWTLDLVWVLVYLLTAATVFYCCAWSSTQMKLIKHDQPALRDWHEDCDRIPPFSSIIYSVQHTWEMFGCRSDEGGTPSGIRDEEKLPHTDLGRLFESISGDTSGASSAMLWDHQRLEVGSSLEPLGSPFLGKLRGTKDMPRVLDQPAARQSGRSRLATAGTFVSTHVSCTVTRWNPFDTHFVSKFESQINSICHVDIAEQDQTVYANGTEKCVNSTVLGLSGELRDIFCVCRVTIVSFYWRQFKILFGIFLVETILLIIDFVSHYLSILFSRREAWCKNRLQLRQNVFLQLAHEKLDPEEALVCKGNFDDRVVLWQVLCFLLISNVLLPVSLLILPCYLERKEREHVEQMLLVSVRRIIVQRCTTLRPLVFEVDDVKDVRLIPPPWQKFRCGCRRRDVSLESVASRTMSLTFVLKTDRWITVNAVTNGSEIKRKINLLLQSSQSSPSTSSQGQSSSDQPETPRNSNDTLDVVSGPLRGGSSAMRLEELAFFSAEWHEAGPPLLHMRFCCNGVKWSVIRSQKSLAHLHLWLTNRRVRLGPGVRTPWLPRGVLHSLLRDGVNPEAHSTALRHYLQDCLCEQEIYNSTAFRIFIEMSSLSLCIKGSRREKLLEGYVWRKKRSRFRKRWLLLREDHLCYTRTISSGIVRDTFMFDETLRVVVGKEESGREYGLVVQTDANEFVFQCSSGLEVSLWQRAILDAKAICEYCRNHPFEGSSPSRQRCRAMLLINDVAHFEAIISALCQAEHSVYMSDWQPTAALALLQQGEDGDTRLVDVLKQRAAAGVQIFILLHRGLEPAVINDSSSGAAILKDPHPNITVLCYPDHRTLFWLWSHHERFCIVDDRVAFVGGLDLCLGRYDTPQHPLLEDESISAGSDSCVSSVRDSRGVREIRAVEQNLLDRTAQPRMPWHSVSVRLEGAVCLDLARHYLQGWIHAKSEHCASLSVASPRLPTSSPHTHWRDITHRLKRGLRMRSQRKQAGKSSIPQVTSVATTVSTESAGTSESSLRRSPPSRSDYVPSQPSSCSSTDCLPSVQRSALSFRPAEKDVDSSRSPEENLSWHGERVSHLERRSSFSQERRLTSSFTTVQLLRSVCFGSHGVSRPEASIHSAYTDLIDSAQHYIYMENQFFISSTHRDGSDSNGTIKNKIGKALADRIVRAARMSQPFKAYIVMPAMPALEVADLKSQRAWTCRKTMHYQFNSLCSGANSLISTLEAELPKGHLWTDYLGVFCLIGLETAPNGTWHAEQIYVHSKVLIVDDARAIIGSANVNDRSMVGDRDSEVCVLIEDGPELDSFELGLLGGDLRQVGKFCREARLRLWHEHFGLLDGKHHAEKIALMDASSELCWSTWRSVAASRSTALDSLGMWPTSAVTNWQRFGEVCDHRVFAENSAEFEPPLLLVPPPGTPRPHVAEFPLKFLQDEDICQPDPLPRPRGLSNPAFLE